MAEQHGAAAVGIVVRTKDRPVMLRRALRSIGSQTYSGWLAVIVNDGGSPETVDLVVAEQDEHVRSRIRVLHNPRSEGRWPAANAGVAATETPLLVLHDDDDSWHPDFLAETVRFLEENTDERGVIARTEVILEKYEGDGLVVTDRYVLEDHNPSVLLTDLLDFNRFVPISFVYRRTLHAEIGLYDQELPAAADWTFNMKVLQRQPIRYVGDRPLAYWHQRPGVDGVLGNSVFAAPLDHRIADSTYRDAALRAYVNTDGLGLPLYLAQLEAKRDRAAEAQIREAAERESRLNARLDTLEETLRTLQHHLDRTIDTRVRGWAWRQKRRLRELRDRGRSAH
jgi:glycosyltransferase involved in cell wall biosynthesis